MFAGETQADVLMETYLTIPAGVLIATGLVKAMLTPALINLGWRGGHFFPAVSYTHLRMKEWWFYAKCAFADPATVHKIVRKTKKVDEYRAAVERVFREQPLAPTARFHG